MSGHTPGPWTVQSACGQGMDLQVFDGRGPIAALRGHPSLQHANARLIAAAPDLLAALVRLQGWVGEYVDGVGAEFDEARELARAAIAKAGGA